MAWPRLRHPAEVRCGGRGPWSAGINHDSNIISYSNYQVDVIYVNNFIFKEIKNIHKENITIEGVTRKTDTNNPYSY